MLRASSSSEESSRGCPNWAVQAVLGVSGGPGGNSCADKESSVASGRLRMLMGGGGAGNAVEPPSAPLAASGFSAGTAADWRAAAEWSAAAPLSAAATGADQGCEAPAAAGEGAAVLATAGAGDAVTEDGRCMRRKSAPSKEVDRGGSALVAAAL